MAKRWITTYIFPDFHIYPFYLCCSYNTIANNYQMAHDPVKKTEVYRSSLPVLFHRPVACLDSVLYRLIAVFNAKKAALFLEEHGI